MKLRGRPMSWVGAVILSGSVACSSNAPNGAGPAEGSAGISGASSESGGAGSAAGGAGSAGLSACPENPTPVRAQGSVLSLSLAPVLGGKPFVFGQPNALAEGGALIPLNFRFYISEVELLGAGGEAPVAVDLVSAAGTPEPYGVHLFNAEEADSSTLRVLAPPGQYSGLSFALGLKLDCNRQPAASLAEPLDTHSEMAWPHLAGFLFLRYESRFMGTDASAAEADFPAGLPSMVHMGGSTTVERLPHVTVPGAFSLPAGGTLEKNLSVVMEEIFKGATADIDVSDVAVGLLSSDEAVAGERLRRELPELHPFVLEP